MKDSALAKWTAILFSASAMGFSIASAMYFIAGSDVIGTIYIFVSAAMWGSAFMMFQISKTWLRIEDLQERNRKRTERLEKLENFFDDRLDKSSDGV